LLGRKNQIKKKKQRGKGKKDHKEEIESGSPKQKNEEGKTAKRIILGPGGPHIADIKEEKLRVEKRGPGAHQSEAPRAVTKDTLRERKDQRARTSTTLNGGGDHRTRGRGNTQNNGDLRVRLSQEGNFDIEKRKSFHQEKKMK